MTQKEKDFIASQMAAATVFSIFEHFAPSERREARELLDMFMEKLRDVIATDDRLNREERERMQ